MKKIINSIGFWAERAGVGWLFVFFISGVFCFFCLAFVMTVVLDMEQETRDGLSRIHVYLTLGFLISLFQFGRHTYHFGLKMQQVDDENPEIPIENLQKSFFYALSGIVIFWILLVSFQKL